MITTGERTDYPTPRLQQVTFFTISHAEMKLADPTATE